MSHPVFSPRFAQPHRYLPVPGAYSLFLKTLVGF